MHGVLIYNRYTLKNLNHLDDLVQISMYDNSRFSTTITSYPLLQMTRLKVNLITSQVKFINLIVSK